MRENRLSIVVIIVLFLLIILAENYKPKPLDWTPTFSKEDKIPYGNYLLYELLPNLFPKQKIQTVYQPIYNQVTEANKEEQIKNFIFINNSFKVDGLDIEYLQSFVGNGNHVFIAANHLIEAIEDTFNLSVNTDFSPFWGEDGERDSTALNFIHDSLKMEIPYRYKKYTVNFYFEKMDSLYTQILGQDSKGRANFIKIQRPQQGAFYFHAAPLAFTNYNMVDSLNVNYIEKVFSHLPQASVYWDEYYKVGRNESATPLRYILSSKALRSALYLGLGAMLLFVLFESKRRQRIIPEMPPLENTSLEFTKTVGMLYYQNGDHKDIMNKKIIYFFDHLRSKYGIKSAKLRTYNIEAPIFEQLASRSGVPLKDVKILFNLISILQKKPQISPDELMRFNKMMIRFLDKSV